MAGSRRELLALALATAVVTTASVSAAERKDGPPAAAKRVELHIGAAHLGVTLEEVTKDDVSRLKLAEERGALVRSVESGSPAEKAGLKAEDVIVRFQGENIHSARQLARLIREQPSGRNASLEVVRGGATQRLQATLADGGGSMRGFRFEMPDLGAFLDRDFVFDVPEPPEPPEAPTVPRAPRAPRPPRAAIAPFARGFGWAFGGPGKLGIEYQEIGDQLAKYFKLSADSGVLVAHVDEEGPAGKAGMQAGDVLLKVGGRSIRDGGELRDELDKAEPGSELGVTVQRDGRPLELKLKLAGSETRRRRGLST
jgi:serine protease Do